jgi:hypothetical protein
LSRWFASSWASSSTRAFIPRGSFRLGAEGVELESDAPLALFALLKVLLPTDPGNGEGESLDGKVIAVSEGDGVGTALVRFTGIAWARKRIDAFAAGHIGGPSSAAVSR